MKTLVVMLFCSLSAFAQNGWVRDQWNDKLTGNPVVSYHLDAQPDGTGRKPYVAITCDQAGRRFSYGYFTDEMVYVDGQYSSVSELYYPTTVKYRADTGKPKSDYLTVRPDFRTINLDQGLLLALTGGREVAISFPSLRGYMVTDVFASSPLPPQYTEDCYTEKMRSKGK